MCRCAGIGAHVTADEGVVGVHGDAVMKECPWGLVEVGVVAWARGGPHRAAPRSGLGEGLVVLGAQEIVGQRVEAAFSSQPSSNGEELTSSGCRPRRR